MKELEYFIDKYALEMKLLTIKKLVILFSITTLFTGVIEFCKVYIYHDVDFLISLFILIVIDTITGVVRSIKQHKFSSFKFGGLFMKLLLYGIVLETINVLIIFKIDGTHPKYILDWIPDFVFTAMMLREATSILENVALIKPDLLPKWILKRFEAFDEGGLAIKQNGEIVEK